jgi:hypothetical protein
VTTTDDLAYLNKLIRRQRPTNHLIAGNANMTSSALIDFDSADAKTVKALIYGKPGSGKTNIGVSAPKPLILLTEMQAAPNIKKAAARLGRKVPPTFPIRSLDDFRAVVKAAHGDRSKPFTVQNPTTGDVLFALDEWPESIVMDSLTDACEMVSEEIRRQSPPRQGKDGLPVDSERYWNVLMDRCSKLVRSFRDLPFHVLFLALLKDKETGEGDEKSRYIGPQLPMNALPNVVMSAVNVVGVTYRRRGLPIPSPDGTKTGEGKPVMVRPMAYGVATTGPDFMELKPYPPLRDNEVTDFASWVKRINGEDDGQAAPPPMDTTAVTTDE